MTTPPFAVPVTIRPRIIAGAAPDTWAVTSEIIGADGKFYFAIMGKDHAEYSAAIARAVNGQAEMVAEISSHKATIEWLATAIPVLRAMCKTANLTAGAAKAQEMLDYLARAENDATHDWCRPDFAEYDCCRRCGIVRRRDRKNNKCRGIVHVGLRDDPARAAIAHAEGKT